MSFIWANLLWLLLLVPALVLVYLLLLGRKKKLAIRYANLSMVKDAASAGAHIRRHVPAVLMLLALTLMITAIARPQATVTLPSQRSTVILAIDVSGSMRAEDVEPNRIAAAQAAAKTFVADQPSDVRVGVVAFAGSALLVQAPTFNREDIIKAIDSFEVQRGTAIGSGILVALKTLFPDANFDTGTPDYQRSFNGRNFNDPHDREMAAQAERQAFVPVPPGSNSNSVIILLSDGQATTGPDPIDSARRAAERGVRIFTVGLGSREGAIVAFGGRSMRVQLDEETLGKIADVTRGSYFRASTAKDLKTIYKSLNTQLIMEARKTEVTAFFAAAAAALALIAAGLSLLWFNRIL